MRVQFKQEWIDYDDIGPLRGLLATTTGLLWLRVLSLLKSINSQLATFVLAIFQISRDILWFLVILSVLVISFSQVRQIGRMFSLFSVFISFSSRCLSSIVL